MRHRPCPDLVFDATSAALERARPIWATRPGSSCPTGDRRLPCAIVNSGGSVHRVAILDDHAAFAEALCAAFDRADDMECVGHVGAIPDCVRLGLAERPDVIIIDYHLLEGTGLDCALQLRAAGVDSHLMMLTAHAGAELAAEAIRSGINGGVYPKHTPLEDVFTAVRSLVMGTA